MATIIDKLLIEIGLTSDKVKAQTKEILAEVEKIKKAEQELTKFSVKQEKTKTEAKTKERKKRTKEAKAEVKEEIEQIEETSEAVEQSAKDTKKSLDFVDVAAKRIVSVWAVKKVMGAIKDATMTSAEFDRLSSSMTSSSETMRMWSNAVELIGGDANKTKNDLVSLQSQLDRFALFGEGAEELAQRFGAMGISLYTPEGKAKTSADLYGDIAEYVRQNPMKLTPSQLRELSGMDVDTMYLMTRGQQEFSKIQSQALENAKTQQKNAEASQKIFTQGWASMTQQLGTGAAAVGGGLSSYFLNRGIESAESGGNVNAVSPKGARGPMQLMPSTFYEWAGKIGIQNPDINNPEQNRAVGSAYEQFLLNRYGGNVGRSLAAYNWGMGNVDQSDWQKKMPQETRDYLGNVMVGASGGELRREGSNIRNVQTGDIIINTGPNADPYAIVDAINQRLNVDQLNTGTQ